MANAVATAPGAMTSDGSLSLRQLEALVPQPGGSVLLATRAWLEPARQLASAGAAVSVLVAPPAVARETAGNGLVSFLPLEELERAAAPRFTGAVVLDVGGVPVPELLRLVHRHLAAGARVLFGTALSAPPASDPRGFVIALSEAGFVLLDEAPTGGPAPAPRPLLARSDALAVRGYRPGDEAQILALFPRCFFVERSLARWRWEYMENPYGALQISLAFTAEGTLAAHYAGYPVRYWSDVGGAPRQLAALQIGDTMTEPSLRHLGRGPTSLLARTARHFYASYCSGRVAFNYGVNTGNIQRFSMRYVGAKHLEAVALRVLPLPPSGLAAPATWRRRLAGFRLERVRQFDQRFDELFARAAPDYHFLIERSARYLDWRYARCPDPEYFCYAGFARRRLVGWCVFRSQGERLLWGDALFDRRHVDQLRPFLAAVLELPEHRQARRLETWLSPRPSWWRAAVDGLGLVEEPEPNRLGLVFVPFEEDPEAAMRSQLYWAMGDSDLF
jgi:hypothetical protein